MGWWPLSRIEETAGQVAINSYVPFQKAGVGAGRVVRNDGTTAQGSGESP